MENRTHKVKIVIWENNSDINSNNYDMFDMIINHNVKYIEGYKKALDTTDFVLKFNKKYNAKISINDMCVNNLVEKPYIEKIYIQKENSKIIYRLLKLEQINASYK